MILRLNIDTTKEQDAESIDKAVDDQTKAAVILWADAVRSSVERSQISHAALLQTFPAMKSETLQKHYEAIIKVFCPDVKVVADYTFEVHRCFIAGTLHQIMNKMDEFYKDYTK